MKVLPTKFANLVRRPNGTYYARCKIRQRTVWKSLRVNAENKARVLLPDALKKMRGVPVPKGNELPGNASFRQVMEVYKRRMAEDCAKKERAPRTLETKLRSERLFLRTWGALLDVRVRSRFVG